MAEESKYPFSLFTFAAKEIGKVETRPGCWDMTRVGIFQVPILRYPKTEDEYTLDWLNASVIGAYTRNYFFTAGMFYAFRRAGQWYALYSSDYTATRVMRIFEKDGRWTWEDWCGQEPDGAGFCPLEFYVPQNYDLKTNNLPSECPLLTVDEELPYEISNGEVWKKYEISNGEVWKKEVYRPDFGFVGGTVWGDDSTGIKLQFVDFTGLEDKVYKQEERFGYLPLPNVEISKLIDTRCSSYVCGYNRRIIHICGFAFDFDSGELLAEDLKVDMKNDKPKK